MPKIMKKKCVMAKRVSLLRRMRHVRQDKINKKQEIENSEDRSEFSVSDVPGTSNELNNEDRREFSVLDVPVTSKELNACENDVNIINDLVTSPLAVSTCEIIHDNQKGNVIDIFNDDSDGSVLDVREYCINNIFDVANEPNLNENMEIDDDTMSLGSISNVSSEKIINNACQNNVKNIMINKNVENIENLENVENLDNSETEDIENIALHTDENIDVDRLNSIEINGRCIVDFGYVFAELQRLSCHWINECRLIDLCITKIKRHGLKTQYFVECRMCHFKDSFWSEPTNDKILDVNKGAVCGTILTGTGHTQLEELLTAVDVPCMSKTSYLDYHEQISEAFAIAVEEEMRVAGKEEKRLAIERGDLINDIPYIPVVTDGSWMKRSYRSGSYDSPSGAAVIMGYYTGKVLFVGIRNKYCVVCARAAKVNEKLH
ncbi:uncharacterized protein [Cardiocondyla obscurior]|uniref:uncharacterized protein n=1 Tax=Cardiocondyla obscurior TaxID=286306 RepID=UPI0039656047